MDNFEGIIAYNIKKHRKLKGLTQAELSKLSNMSRSYLGDLERGRYHASIETLNAIAKSLDVELTTLITDPDGEAGVEQLNQVENDVDIRRIERAHNKMSPEKKKAMMTVLENAFVEFFDKNDRQA